MKLPRLVFSTSGLESVISCNNELSSLEDNLNEELQRIASRTSENAKRCPQRPQKSHTISGSGDANVADDH